MFYHARYYAPRIGRFAQADTIVPDPANPQALNRYSYVNNRPLVYIDPSGHYAALEDNDYSLDDCLNNGGCIYPPGHHKAGSIILWTEEQKDRIARNRTVAGIITDLLPGIGDVKGLVEVFTGRDLATGASLGGWRWLGILGVSELRPIKHIDEFLPASVPIGRALVEGNLVQVGRWVRNSPDMNEAARAYQRFVTGAVEGWEFLRNGVHFDGIRLTETCEAVLLDAKHGDNWYRHVLDPDRSFIAQKTLKQADSQVRAAAGLAIEWHVTDQRAVEPLKTLFEKYGIDIAVALTPWSP
jgi:hypothetical protein